MASNYAPVIGTWNIVETHSFRQLPLPIVQREIKSGSAVWLNTVSGNTPVSFIEPAINSASSYFTSLVTSSSSNTTFASKSSSRAAAQQSFAELFMGICQNHRTPKQFLSINNWDSPNVSSTYYDSSTPFVNVITSGIAVVPWLDDGGNTTVQTALGIGTGLGCSTFQTNSTGFIDGSGLTQNQQVNSAYPYYCYSNSVCQANSQSAIIARLWKNAEVGASQVYVEFSSALSTAASNVTSGSSGYSGTTLWGAFSGYSGQTAGVSVY